MSSTTLQYATSKDGTTIAYDRLGDGPPVVLVSGGSVDRSSNAGLAEQRADARAAAAVLRLRCRHRPAQR